MYSPQLPESIDHSSFFDVRHFRCSFGNTWVEQHDGMLMFAHIAQLVIITYSGHAMNTNLTLSAHKACYRIIIAQTQPLYLVLKIG